MDVLSDSQTYLPTVTFRWIGMCCAGGLCYTIGVIFYVWERLKFSHLLWHIFVLAGSIFHFFAVLFYVIII